ncbi:carbon-nitrogen hydrolase family protein [Larkinella humicola]|uniref:Carbon-nitrogen hydrolase family protein n=1 Tax=Larkinella humicola TaxID=2607654 RepID=A0A5N1JLM8_9BACT|nr:carbon-nitrogen hydrolase family protein [Larkinella humicola]KAA9354596.1 carbon-nitrogen hydrolase family protein [Larkinella humicola]
MKIGVAQTRPVKGDIAHNIANHQTLIDLAVSDGADLLIFPELSLTGYEPELAADLATTPDDSRFDVFQTRSDAHRITIGVGVPIRSEEGIWISLLIFQPHQPRHLYSKKYLHEDEEPFFVSGQSTLCFLGDKANIALAICYELSVPEHSGKAFQNGATVYLASVAKSAPGMEKASETLSAIARTNAMTVFVSNCVGYCDNFESAGRSAIWNTKGELIRQLNDVDEGILIIDLETGTGL